MQIIRFAIFALTALGFCQALPGAAQGSKAIPPQAQAAEVKRYTLIYQFHRSRLEYPEAIAAISSAIALSPNDADLYAMREELYASTFVIDKALADANKAIALQPNYCAYIRRRGRLFYMNGDYAKSLADFTACIQLEPYDSEQRLARARVYRKLEKYDLAIADYRIYNNFKKVHRLQDGCNELGELYLKTGKSKEAIATFTQLIAAFPDLPQGYYGRAKAYEAIGETQKASSDRKKAQEAEKSF
jgi:tetratricopeptide (TPR) repeat protein